MTGVFQPKQYDAKTREFLNLALRGLLSHYGHPFGLVIKGFRIDSDPVELLQTAPGLIHILVAAGHLKKGTLSSYHASWLAELIDKLVPTLASASGGDEFAEKQVKAIHKILEHEKYELPVTAIEEIIEKHHTRPALARGWAIRSIMGKLSCVVEPGQPGKTVLEGRIKLISNPNMREYDDYWPEYGGFRRSYEVALEHWPKRGAPTLKSLAIKVYLKQLQKEGFTTISEATLENDLQELAEWDKTQSEEDRRYLGVLIYNAGGRNIRLPWQPYSEGWKQSRHYEKNKTGVKTTIKKGGKKAE